METNPNPLERPVSLSYMIFYPIHRSMFREGVPYCLLIRFIWQISYIDFHSIVFEYYAIFGAYRPDQWRNIINFRPCEPTYVVKV